MLFWNIARECFGEEPGDISSSWLGTFEPHPVHPADFSRYTVYIIHCQTLALIRVRLLFYAPVSSGWVVKGDGATDDHEWIRIGCTCSAWFFSMWPVARS